jgi:hypothetical protein
MGTKCQCGQGYVSAYDGKCGHCRTRKELEHHKRLLSQPKTPEMLITVVNKHHLKDHGPADFYVGRGSPLGNPYKITSPEPAHRTNVINLYRERLRSLIQQNDGPIIDELNLIANKILAGIPVRLLCFCKPKPCHGDVIKRIICEEISNNT